MVMWVTDEFKVEIAKAPMKPHFGAGQIIKQCKGNSIPSSQIFFIDKQDNGEYKFNS